MSLVTASRFARRELRGGLSGFRILLACLALGVAAIAAVGTVRSAIEAGLAQEGARLLGGDAQLEFTYRFASDAEKAWMNGVADRVSEVVDFRSMAVVERGGETERALTQVKAVDDLYPLLGAVRLDPEMPLATALDGQEGMPGAVMKRVLADRLGLAPGDSFRLGQQAFRLSAVLVVEPDDAGGGFALGPRTILRTAALADSGLIGPGTLFETEYRMDLPPGADIAALEREAEARFRDSGARWQDSRNGAPGIREFVNRLGSFLVLVGLSGLAVGGVGVAAAVRAYLAGKTEVIATLKTLGADRRTIFLTYLIQIAVLSLAGVALGLVIGAAAPLLLAPLIEARLPVPAAFALYPAPLAEAAVYGLLAAFLFALWPLARTDEVRAATLFRDIGAGARGWPARVYLLAMAMLLMALLAAAVVFSGAAELALWTAGGILAVLAVLALAAAGVRALAARSTRVARGRPALRLAVGAIGGPRQEAASVILSLGLGLSVLAAVGQIDGNLRAAISRDLPEVAPSYFFVDIQNDQLPGFLDRLKGDPAVSRVDTAPMLRGIITEINGQPAREVAGDHWVLNGDRGVTYAAAPGPETTVTDGDWWPADYSGPPQVSFAREEALELGLALGDEITVNILGRDLTATVTSFRNVDFSTAGIGFIMSMNPSALSAAPHTHISTVYAAPEAEAAILRDLAGAYPNITAISVRDAIDRVSQVLAGVAAATSYGAAATLVTGLVVLIGAAAAGERARTYEAAVLKTLGASRARILTSFALRSALTGLAAGGVAIAAGIAAGWAVSRFVMETDFAVTWPSALGIVTGGVVLTLLAGLAFAWRPLAARPARVLRARE
ncbi:ABC transporter permease [Rhodovulum sp. YNF3179]|uniref:ABC transporter permease n=1 Tax=Rhodovulum sp. YNF3179 TaxID=3425127 RepID=UPI003D32C0CD